MKKKKLIIAFAVVFAIIIDIEYLSPNTEAKVYTGDNEDELNNM